MVHNSDEKFLIAFLDHWRHQRKDTRPGSWRSSYLLLRWTLSTAYARALVPWLLTVSVVDRRGAPAPGAADLLKLFLPKVTMSDSFLCL